MKDTQTVICLSITKEDFKISKPLKAFYLFNDLSLNIQNCRRDSYAECPVAGYIC